MTKVQLRFQDNDLNKHEISGLIPGKGHFTFLKVFLLCWASDIYNEFDYGNMCLKPIFMDQL